MIVVIWYDSLAEMSSCIIMFNIKVFIKKTYI